MTANDLRFLAALTAADAVAPDLPAVQLAQVVRVVLDQVDGHAHDLATIHALPGADVPARHETPVADVAGGAAVWYDFEDGRSGFYFVDATEARWGRIDLFYAGGIVGHFKAGDWVLVADDPSEADRYNRGTWASPLDELAADGHSEPDPGGWAA